MIVRDMTPNTFLNKVVAERNALAVVNSAYRGSLQLSGLSVAAIKSWQNKVLLPTSHRAVQILLALGEVAQTLSNRSNESFASLNANVQAKLDELMAELKATVEAARSEGSQVTPAK